MYEWSIRVPHIAIADFDFRGVTSPNWHWIDINIANYWLTILQLSGIHDEIFGMPTFGLLLQKMQTYWFNKHLPCDFISSLQQASFSMRFIFAIHKSYQIYALEIFHRTPEDCITSLITCNSAIITKLANKTKLRDDLKNSIASIFNVSIDGRNYVSRIFKRLLLYKDHSS
jgi:hypothetical protein